MRAFSPVAERLDFAVKLVSQRETGQLQIHAAPFVQGEAHVLDEVVDEEAGIEIALYHTLAVHFENPRRGEAAHQGLPHQCRIGAGF